jgi:hypothetical protein
MRVPLETQRSFYLTLISMLQSLAFGYLLTTISLKDLLTPSYGLQVLSTFLVILLVWHEYAIGTMLFAWLVDFWDSTIPFLFGIVQFFLISALKPQDWSASAWFFCLSAFAALSLWASWNQFAKGSAHVENREVLSIYGHTKHRTMIYVAVSCVVFLVEGIFARSAPRNGWLLLTLVAAGTIVLVVFAARGIFLYPRIMSEINVQESDPSTSN